MLVCDVLSLAMPKKREESEQVGLRLNKAQLTRLRQYANNHLLKPTLTQLIDGAISEFLERHDREESEPPRAGKPRK